MAPEIRLLMVEDNRGDAELELYELKRAGLQVAARVVDTPEDFRRELREFVPDVIVSDFSMPRFDGMSALRLARELAPDVPFLFVSGTIGEENAISALREGATDYLLKDRIRRFPAAINRAIAEAQERRERRRAQAGLDRAQAMAKLAHVITGKGGVFESWSENLPGLIGVARMPRSTRDWLELVHPEDRDAFRRSAIDADRTSERVDVEYRVRRADGRLIHIRQVMEPLAAQQAPGITEWFSTLQDITDQKRDPLTGLANAALFRGRLAQHIAAARGGKLAVMIFELTRFKSVNDSLGREAGDEVLKEIGRRLASAHEPARVARLGADRFAIVVPGVQNEDEVARLAEQRIAQCFGAPHRAGDSEILLSGKAGIAIFPNDGTDADALLTHAEAAVKKAKAGGEKFLFYNQRMSERAAEILTLEGKLRRALERCEFALHYQPKVDLTTRQVVGVEALLRWQCPERGLVPPGSFIGVLEESGLILDVGLWAIERAARDHHSWVERGLPAPRIAVNVSAVQLREREFVASVRAALEAGCPAPGIDLEITESLLMDDIEETIEKLKRARELGVSIAIDDFGTGYSSLAYLSKLPVSTLKIDRSFINGMVKDPDATSIVNTIIGLAHSLRLQVVAEGVEEEAQATMLRLLRCDQMQGYLFSKPLAVAQLEGLLNSNRPAAK
jgi:diguanylate cyclase (GGDEF)-like protein/PAS domain S-box-containing protein